jgi:hypothetical protein
MSSAPIVAHTEEAKASSSAKPVAVVLLTYICHPDSGGVDSYHIPLSVLTPEDLRRLSAAHRNGLNGMTDNTPERADVSFRLGLNDDRVIYLEQGARSTLHEAFSPRSTRGQWMQYLVPEEQIASLVDVLVHRFITMSGGDF